MSTIDSNNTHRLCSTLHRIALFCGALCSAMPGKLDPLPVTSLRLPRSTPCHGDHLRGRPSWRKRARLRKPREKIIRIFLPKRICFEVLFNLNRHGFPCGTLTESIWEWISARRRLSLSLIGPHCRHSSPGIMRFMNASNKGTVKAVSP